MEGESRRCCHHGAKDNASATAEYLRWVRRTLAYSRRTTHFWDAVVTASVQHSCVELEMHAPPHHPTTSRLLASLTVTPPLHSLSTVLCSYSGNEPASLPTGSLCCPPWFKSPNAVTTPAPHRSPLGWPMSECHLPPIHESIIESLLAVAAPLPYTPITSSVTRECWEAEYIVVSLCCADTSVSVLMLHISAVTATGGRGWWNGHDSEHVMGMAHWVQAAV